MELIRRGSASWYTKQNPPNFDPVNRHFCFRKIANPQGVVGPALIGRAHEIAEFVAADLALPPPALVFFEAIEWRETGAKIGPEIQSMYTMERSQTFRFPINASGYAAVTLKNELWVFSDLPTPRLETIIAHEIRHIWQRSQGARFSELMEAEMDAYPYGFTTARRFLESRGELTSEAAADLSDRLQSFPDRCAAQPYIHALSAWGHDSEPAPDNSSGPGPKVMLF